MIFFEPPRERGAQKEAKVTKDGVGGLRGKS